MILIYDGDNAGQNATQRAIPILEKAGLQVKVLQMKDAKDPDEFLHKFGADRFKLLLEDSSNRVEYQLNAIAKKYDLKLDDERIKFIHEAAELISTLGSAVQREVYGHRIAEAGKITYDSMKAEIEKAFKRRMAIQKKKQEKLDMAPVRTRQPASRTIRYDNVKSAMAEEGVIALALKEPALRDGVGSLTGESFSVPLLGRVFDMLRQRQGEEEIGLALQTLLDQAGEAGGGVVYLPSGIYRLEKPIRVPSGVELLVAKTKPFLKGVILRISPEKTFSIILLTSRL